MKSDAERVGSWSRAELWGLGLVSALTVSLFIGGLAGLRFNLSASHPGFLFWKLPRGDVAVGDLVAFCLPFPIDTYPIMRKASRRLCAADQSGDLVLKRVIDINSGGDLWMLGVGPGSLDSRAFGKIPGTAIRYRVAELW